MHQHTEEPSHNVCAVDGLMPRLGDKWTIHVLTVLQSANGKGVRFSELKNRVTGISQKMLTVTLRALERDGLVQRNLFAEVPPRVEYQLTEMGSTLLPAMSGLIDWLHAQWPEIQNNRKRYDKP